MPHENPISSVDEHRIRELKHYGPVTAIKLHDYYIYVGYGPSLKIFDRDDQDKIVFDQQLFKRNKIHSIAVHGSRVAVAGGRSFAVCDPFNEAKVVQEKSINEWIIAVEFISKTRLLLLTSHNEAIEIEILDDLSLKMVEKVHCNERSILYSGSIRVVNESTIYIAAGTVMNGIIVWDLRKRKIVHNLTDHEGSIFGVKIDSTGQYIVSCSDDRSVKLYSISGKLLATGWGHGSRIWTLEFVSVIDGTVRLFSAGEDCTVRIWEYQEKPELQQVELYDHFHSGKHIWSGDVSNENEAVFVSGGADGKIRAERFEQNEIKRIVPVTIADDNSETEHQVKAFGILQRAGFLMVCTSTGEVLVKNRDAKRWKALKVKDVSEEQLSRYTMIKSIEEADCFALCSENGDVILVGFDRSKAMHCVVKANEGSPKKIINVLTASYSYPKPKNLSNVSLLLNSPIPSEPMEVVTFVQKKAGAKFEISSSIDLQKLDPKTFIPTSFYLDPVNQLVFVGSRHANFAVYDTQLTDSQDPKRLKKLCSGDTISAIRGVQSHKGQCVVLVTLRDGIYMLVKASQSSSGVEITTILQNKIPKSIEGGFMREGRLFLYGFNSSCFSLWDETHQIELCKVPCGGGHRHWEAGVCVDAIQLTFSYMSQGHLFLTTLKSSWSHSHGLLAEGTHGREIRDVAILKHSKKHGMLVATASEDATIKVGNLSMDGEVRYQWTLNNHISGLQRVKFLGEDYLASCAANEELIIWKITRINEELFGVVEATRIEPSEEFPDLRIMDITHRGTTKEIWIAAAYSNSVVKLFLFDKDTLKIKEKIEINYGTVCVLNIQFVTNREARYVMTGSSDGNITFWDATSMLDGKGKMRKIPVIKQQLHQSGIKAIVTIPENDGSLAIITGGDDNSLIRSNLAFEDGTISFVTKDFVKQAASAAITSISQVSDTTVLVTSADQILRLWNIQRGLSCIGAAYTTIADTGCSDYINSAGLGVVGGAGLSTFKFSTR